MAWLTAALSGLFAAVVSSAVTVGVEKLGGTLGGVLATMPTTIVPAAVGLALRLRDDDREFTKAMLTVPLGMLIDGVFLLQWRWLPSRLPTQWRLWKRLTAMVLFSLTVWVALAGGVALSAHTALDTPTHVELVGLLALGGMITLGVAACWHLPPSPKGSNPVTCGVLVARGVCAGVAIFAAVLIGSLGGVFSGIMSTFPAIFLTSMCALWTSQHAAVPVGAVGPMMLGSTSVAGFAVVYWALMHRVASPYWRALLCWPLAVAACSVPVYGFLAWRRRAQSAASPPPALPGRAADAAVARDSGGGGGVQPVDHTGVELLVVQSEDGGTRLEPLVPGS